MMQPQGIHLLLPTSDALAQFVRDLTACPQTAYDYSLNELIAEAVIASEPLDPLELIAATDIMFDKLSRNHGNDTASVVSKAFFNFASRVKELYLQLGLYEGPRAPYYFAGIVAGTNNIVVGRYT